jgi:hypothetical protein
MMENIFFYTFSTIAQTLAGAIALLAGFVLYRLQLLNAEFIFLGERIEAAFSYLPHKQFKQIAHSKYLLIQGQYENLLAFAEMAEIPKDNYRAEAERETLRTRLIYKATFLRRFYIALYLTAGLITNSIFILINTPDIVKVHFASWILYGSLGWFIMCILSYLWLLLFVFDE